MSGDQQQPDNEAPKPDLRLRKPERGLPPQEPEFKARRPCQCSVCQEVPEPSDSDDRFSCENETERFAGIYPRGLAFLALEELHRAELQVVRHLEDFSVIIFEVPPSHGNRRHVLSTFEQVFLLVGDAIWTAPEPDLPMLGRIFEAEMRKAVVGWRKQVRRFRKWKAVVFRDHLVLRYKSPAIVPLGLAGVGAVSLTRDCEVGPQVDLLQAEVEIVAYMSDGVDKLATARDTKYRGTLKERDELLLLGVRCEGLACQAVSMEVQKGLVRSRADDTVATLCLMEQDPLGPLEPPRTILDPMCGVGTYLIALRWVLQQRGLDSQHPSELIGVDLDAGSLAHMWENVETFGNCQPCTAILGSSSRLPLKSDSVDLIVADPPWGQRHSSHQYVKHNFRKWVAEWARVLRPGGRAVIVTICKKVFEDQVMPPLQQQGLLELEENIQFDNKGWTVCRLYVVRKPSAPVEVPVQA
eukprot:CAMPEP_0206626258 /NCGR_PEP_ID=MMETSP0325_2-20121206/65196_1 /ASSEMBLY_ACC=CAM_ASM_000347 /TAXON_ID=2866 /ORGANISM="Crypthecodinium cohnii, Strain Seligo" /LENGTH=467 /DNA_ID=CAMNT_0054150543 /DNA_START=55 /DNA_END=1454 /DNA_ORIENTATION=-